MHIKKLELVSEDDLEEEASAGTGIDHNEQRPAYKPVLPVYNNEEVEEPSSIHKHHSHTHNKASSALPKRKHFSSIFRYLCCMLSICIKSIKPYALTIARF